jgi:adenine-specific DNA-methyltransferase
LSDHIVDGPQERYHLNWPGKREALIAANAPIAKTLRPARDESVNFDTTQNLFIEGDNLDALKLLQETYLCKVKMIYIDPPYNTGNDFIYKDDFTESTDEFLERSNQKDEEGNRLVANPDSNGRFHSDWLSMMYSRLKLSRNILADDGVIFISIGADEIGGLRYSVSDVFGEENFISICTRVMKSGGQKGRFFSPNTDYVLVCAKNINALNNFRGELDEELIKKVYNKIETQGERQGQYYRTMGIFQSSLDARKNQRYYVETPDGKYCIPPGSTFPPEERHLAKIIPNSGDGCWRWITDRFEEEMKKENVIFVETTNSPLICPDGSKSKYNVYSKIWLSDRQEEGSLPLDILTNYENRHSSKELSELKIPFDYSKPVSLVKHLIQIMGNNSTELILDFFAGSSTSAHAVMQLNAEDGGNRKFIMVQLPEQCDPKSEAAKDGYSNIAEISKERIRRAGAKILEGECHQDWNKDVGFRVLKIDTSNMKDVYYRPDEVDQSDLLSSVDNIKPNRTGEDLLFQVLVDWGVDLTLPIRHEKIEGKSVYFVDDDALIACFETGINVDFVKQLATHKPLRVVFRDNGFASDDVKANVAQIFRQTSPDTDIKVI